MFKETNFSIAKFIAINFTRSEKCTICQTKLRILLWLLKSRFVINCYQIRNRAIRSSPMYAARKIEKAEKLLRNNAIAKANC